jgi:hypothetical protein
MPETGTLDIKRRGLKASAAPSAPTVSCAATRVSESTSSTKAPSCLAWINAARQACRGWTRTWPALCRTATPRPRTRRTPLPVERDAHGSDVAPEEAVTGPNPEEGGGGDSVQSRGGRSTLLGKKGGAPLPMPLGKKSGAPRSPCPRAAAPPDATTDGEEEGSVVVCVLTRRRASLCHCRCWRRREERCSRCHWGRREERRSLHTRVLPHLRLLPMGKKRGVQQLPHD